MCYSKQQSLLSFILNILSSSLLLYYSSSLYSSYSHLSKILALFFLFVGLMQFFDWIFWTHQDINIYNTALVNFTFTKIAFIINHLQPILLAFLIYYFNNSLQPLSKFFILIYSFASLLYIFFNFNNISYTLTQDNILKWDWNYQSGHFFMYLLFVITLSILAYENFTYPINLFLLFINLFTYLFSLYFFKQRFIGRFWCKIASLLPLLFLFLIIFQKN